jgi:hypothetical protein
MPFAAPDAGSDRKGTTLCGRGMVVLGATIPNLPQPNFLIFGRLIGKERWILHAPLAASDDEFRYRTQQS